MENGFVVPVFAGMTLLRFALGRVRPDSRFRGESMDNTLLGVGEFVHQFVQARLPALEVV